MKRWNTIAILLWVCTASAQVQLPASCDSLLRTGMPSGMTDTARYMGIQAACGEPVISLFNPSFFGETDCCVLRYFESRKVYFIFTPGNEAPTAFDKHYQEGFNYIMNQRVRQQLGAGWQTIPDSVTRDRLVLGKEVADELRQSLKLKVKSEGRVLVKLKNKNLHRFDSAEVHFPTAPDLVLHLRDLYKGTVIPSKHDGEKHIETIVFDFDFRFLKNNRQYCLCQDQPKFTLRYDLPGKKH